MGKNKKNKKKKKGNSSKNAHNHQPSKQTETQESKGKGRKRQHSPHNSQRRGNDLYFQSEREQINSSGPDVINLSSHEVHPKRQKRVAENDQPTERSIDRAPNAETSQHGNFSGNNQVTPHASGSGESSVGVNQNYQRLAYGHYQVLRFQQ